MSLKEETAESFTELKGDDNAGPDTPGVSMKQFAPVVGSVVRDEEEEGVEWEDEEEGDGGEEEEGDGAAATEEES